MSDSCLLKPDREFVERTVGSGGGSLKKCYQCATCSVVCELAPDHRPFPRKEMIWAQWGLKDRLLADPDVWLCHQCSDCSTHCPRGARPADVLAAIRRQTVLHFAVPGFLGRWLEQPKFLPLLLAIPAVLLGLALLVRAPIEQALGIAPGTGETIAFAFWNKLPHWLVISFFGFFSILALVAMGAGLARFWRAMKAADARNGATTPVKRLGPSIGAALKRLFSHDDFGKCTTERRRLLSHMCVFYGFLALTAVAVWVLISILTAGFNPLIRTFAYPFSFWNPWRMLANLGAVAVVAGCLLMIWDRVARSDRATSTYFDWTLLGALLAVVLTGLLSETLHYLRMEPHRQMVYFVHLVFVFALLIYLPYSKLAHLLYRTTALVYAEHTGRTGQALPTAAGGGQEPETDNTAPAPNINE